MHNGMMRVLTIIILLFPWACAQALQAGAAKVEITPAPGVPLNGYGYRMGRGAVDAHDPLWVRCLYLEEGDTRLFLVTSDLCVITRELRERVLALAPDEVPKENIILTATHTHNGPGGMSKALAARVVSGRFMPEVLEQTARSFVQSMRDAYTAAYGPRGRGTIGYGTAQQLVLSKNRRHPIGPIDTQIGVIRVDDSDGFPIAIVANFAAHPTTVSKDFAFSFSADYAGYFYDALEEMASSGCVAMFMNGAEGNQTCANPEDKEGWERTESIGRLLAIRTKEVANRIDCGEASIHIGFSTPTLPRTLADSILPAATILQTLEIGRLLVTFFPGEPTVEIGLEMRRRALARGYEAQFTVGLANDHLFYFIPSEFYSHSHYEAAMNFYGPAIDEWFYREFSALMTRADPGTRGDPEPNSTPKPEPNATSKPAGPPEVASVAGVPHVVTRGTPYAIGHQRGQAFREAILAAYQEHVIHPVEDGSLVPDTGLWNLAPAFIDRTPLALPRMAIGARTLLAGLSESLLEEVLGMADAVELPFDALWLLQCAPGYLTRDQRDGLYAAPLCTMFAVVGDRAGADGLLVGRTLDWDAEEKPAVIEVRPESGYAYVQVGFAWNAGVFTAMNEKGLVLCAERMEPLGVPGFDAPPIELVLRDVLLTAGTLKEAVARVLAVAGLRGYHVLVADPAAGDAVVLELGPEPKVRRPEGGLLLGADPEGQHVDDDGKIRYARIAQLFRDERIIAPTEIQAALGDQERGQSGKARIFNGSTRHAVVFEPRALKVHVAFPLEDGQTLGPFETITLGRGPS